LKKKGERETGVPRHFFFFSSSRPRELAAGNKKEKKERKKYPIGRFYKLIVNNVPEHIVPQIPDLIM
jgi:hypothetical protein